MEFKPLKNTETRSEQICLFCIKSRQWLRCVVAICSVVSGTSDLRETTLREDIRSLMEAAADARPRKTSLQSQTCWRQGNT